jgi:hypothetical protein
VLEGGVRKIADRVAITAQLMQASNQSVIWGQHYEREIKDLLRVQEEVAAAITGEVLNSVPHTAMPAREGKPRSVCGLPGGPAFLEQAHDRKPYARP